MFQRTTITRAVSTYVQFIKEKSKSKTLSGLSFEDRGRKLGQLYKALTPREKKDLASRAKKTNYTKPAAKPRRVRSPYLQFVKTQLPKVRGGSPTDRLKKVAKMWNAKK